MSRPCFIDEGVLVKRAAGPYSVIGRQTLVAEVRCGRRDPVAERRVNREPLSLTPSSSATDSAHAGGRRRRAGDKRPRIPRA